MWNKITYNKLWKGIHIKNTLESGICVHHRWEKNHFCFDRACTARGEKLLLNLLVLLLMDLNRRLDRRRSNRSWPGWDESWEMRLVLPNRCCWYNDSRLRKSLPIILQAIFTTLFNLSFSKPYCDWKCQYTLGCSSVKGQHDLCGQTKWSQPS